MPRIATLPTAYASSTGPYTVGFAGYLAAGRSLASATWSIDVDRTAPGATVDGNPGARLLGSATVDETAKTTTQQIGGLVAGNDYVIEIAGTDDTGNVVVLWTILPCRAAGTAAIAADNLAGQLAGLKVARATGVLTVRHGDTLTTYRSLAEMDRIIQGLESQIAAASGQQPARRYRLLTTKGL